MSENKVYLKLHPNASSFQDQTSGVMIVADQVLEFDETQITSPRVAQAMRDGHVKEATEKEFKAYQDSLAGNEPKESDEDDEDEDKEVELPTAEELEDYDLDELLDILPKLGMAKKKLKAAQKLTSTEELVKLIETFRK